MADDSIPPDEAAAKTARRKAQKAAATARFFAKQKAEGRNYYAEWYAKNREKRRADRRAWVAANQDKERAYRAANAERISARVAKWAKANPDRVKAKAARWRETHPTASRLATKQSYAKHREKRLSYMAAYRVANLEQYRAAQSLVRAKRRGVPGTYSPTDIARLFATQHGRCAYCRKSIRNGYHVDHITPISKGGSNWPRNLQLTCVSCNLRKHAKDPIEFAQENGRLL
jgi:5-methylcytosine-specific restriction endonuclease McrA